MTDMMKMDSCIALSNQNFIFLFAIYIFTFIVCEEQHTFIYKELKVHNHNTRSANNFRLPITNLTKYQKGGHYAGIKIFNRLPTHIKCVANEIQVFKRT